MNEQMLKDFIEAIEENKTEATFHCDRKFLILFLQIMQHSKDKKEQSTT